jgi:hypothetical protein
VLQKPTVHDGLIVVYQNIIALAFILPTGINIAKGPTDLYSAPVCLVGEPRERSGADPLPRLFGWGAVRVERLQEEYTPKMRVGSVR